jgi:hypothetical protein
VYGVVSASNTANFGAAVSVAGLTRLQGGAVLSNAVDVYGVVSASNTANFGAAVNVTGATTLLGPATALGIASFSNVAYFSSNLTVAGTLTALTVRYTNSNVTIYHNEEITSNLFVDGTLLTSNVATFASRVNIYGVLTTSNAAAFTSNVRVSPNPIAMSMNAALQANAVVDGWSSNNWVAGSFGGSGGNAASNAPRVVAGAFMGKATVGAYNSNLGAWDDVMINSNAVLVKNNGYVGIGANFVGSNILVNYPLQVFSRSTFDSKTSIYADGDILAFSDRRVKTNLRVIDGALDRVGRISGYTYNRTDAPTGPRMCGLIAQELAEVLPEAVSTDPDTGMMSVAYGNVASLLVEAVKELRAEVALLRSAAAYSPIKNKIEPLC